MGSASFRLQGTGTSGLLTRRCVLQQCEAFVVRLSQCVNLALAGEKQLLCDPVDHCCDRSRCEPLSYFSSLYRGLSRLTGC